MPKPLDPSIEDEVYETLALHFGVDVSELDLQNIEASTLRAVRDEIWKDMALDRELVKLRKAASLDLSRRPGERADARYHLECAQHDVLINRSAGAFITAELDKRKPFERRQKSLPLNVGA